MKLETRNLSFNFSDKTVFRDVSFTLHPHEILCILGSNGSGKTTLLKVLLGLYKCASGDVLLEGNSIKGWTRSRIAHHVGYVPQNHVPPFPFSVTDVVLMGRTAHIRSFHTPTVHDVEIAVHAMELLHIAHLKDRNYMEISGGERQLVMIARALAQEPEILIMDEPTSNLDYGNQVRILRYIKQLAESGLSIIMTTHYPEHALQYASKVAYMKDNTIKIIEEPKQTITESHLHDLYDIDVTIANIPVNEKQTIPVCFSV